MPEAPGVEQSTKEVATALPAEQQLESVVKQLQQLNPGFDGKEKHKVEQGAVTELSFMSDNVADISPLRALVGLKVLNCVGRSPNNASLTDLSPLHGMTLNRLNCSHTLVSDLSPLRGMPLSELDCIARRFPTCRR